MTLLLALERRAAQWLITDDQPLHGHARQLDLADRTFTIAAALDVLRRQVESPLLIPAVQEIKGFQLDVDDRSSMTSTPRTRSANGFGPKWPPNTGRAW